MEQHKITELLHMKRPCVQLITGDNISPHEEEKDTSIT